jgi:hypothetical protein
VGSSVEKRWFDYGILQSLPRCLCLRGHSFSLAGCECIPYSGYAESPLCIAELTILLSGDKGSRLNGCNSRRMDD